MKSGELLNMLNRAITEKQAAHKSYETYFAQMNNPTLRKIVEGVLQREEEHLGILNSLKDSLSNNGNIEEITARAADGLFRNTKDHEKHADLLRMIMEEAGIGGSAAEISDNVVWEQPEIDEPEVDAYSGQSIAEPPRTVAMGYSRNNNSNRSVFSCRFNAPKTAFRKF